MADEPYEDLTAGRGEKIHGPGIAEMLGEIKDLRDGDRAVLVIVNDTGPTFRHNVESFGCGGRDGEDFTEILGVLSTGMGYIHALQYESYRDDDEDGAAHDDEASATEPGG
jgi:hypothetical protein